MDTPELVVWVVSKHDVINDEFEVEDKGYPTKEYALKRAAHVAQAKNIFSHVWPVRIHQEPQSMSWTDLPAPRLPPSAVYTAEDPDVKLQVAYDVPRRVFRQPEPSLASVVSGAWASWASQQAGRGNFELAAEEPPPIEELFEESPEGQLRLFPRDLPAPAH